MSHALPAKPEATFAGHARVPVAKCRRNGLRSRRLKRRAGASPARDTRYASLAQRKSAFLTRRMSEVRSLEDAPFAFLAQPARAPARHAGGPRFESSRTHQTSPPTCTCSSAVERPPDKRQAGGSIPPGCTRSPHASWSAMPAWSAQRTSYRSGRTDRTLNPVAHARRRFESCLVLHLASVPQSAEGMRRERISWEFKSLRTHQHRAFSAEADAGSAQKMRPNKETGATVTWPTAL